MRTKWHTYRIRVQRGKPCHNSTGALTKSVFKRNDPLFTSYFDSLKGTLLVVCSGSGPESTSPPNTRDKRFTSFRKSNNASVLMELVCWFSVGNRVTPRDPSLASCIPTFCPTLLKRRRFRWAIRRPGEREIEAGTEQLPTRFMERDR